MRLEQIISMQTEQQQQQQMALESISKRNNYHLLAITGFVQERIDDLINSDINFAKFCKKPEQRAKVLSTWLFHLWRHKGLSISQQILQSEIPDFIAEELEEVPSPVNALMSGVYREIKMTIEDPSEFSSKENPALFQTLIAFRDNMEALLYKKTDSDSLEKFNYIKNAKIFTLTPEHLIAYLEKMRNVYDSALLSDKELEIFIDGLSPHAGRDRVSAMRKLGSSLSMRNVLLEGFDEAYDGELSVKQMLEKAIQENDPSWTAHIMVGEDDQVLAWYLGQHFSTSQASSFLDTVEFPHETRKNLLQDSLSKIHFGHMMVTNLQNEAARMFGFKRFFYHIMKHTKSMHVPGTRFVFDCLEETDLEGFSHPTQIYNQGVYQAFTQLGCKRDGHRKITGAISSKHTIRGKEYILKGRYGVLSGDANEMLGKIEQSCIATDAAFGYFDSLEQDEA